MSRAPLIPVLPAGAPVSVLVDYDGTVSRQDVGDMLLAAHALVSPAVVAAKDAVSRLVDRWDDETIDAGSSPERMRRRIRGERRQREADRDAVGADEQGGGAGCPRQHAVRRRRRAAALHVAEHGGARLVTGRLFQERDVAAVEHVKTSRDKDFLRHSF